MWFLRLGAVAIVAAASALDILDTPDYQKCANGLFNQVKEKLDTDMNALNVKLMNVMNVTLKVQQQCTTTPSPAVPQGTQEVSGSNLPTLFQKIEIMEETLNQMQRKLSALATVEDLTQMENSIKNKVEETMMNVEDMVNDSAKKQDVIEVVNESVKVVLGSIEEAQRQCANEVTGAALVTQEVAALKGSVNEMEANFVEMTKRLEGMVTQILNFTQLSLPTLPPSTTTPQGPVYPCEDSTFPGNPGYDVCQAVLRFDKCRLRTVAYHCCHTCTSHNKLPEMGPWRYENASRVVNTLDVFRFFSL
ncbi:uncharacterized protein LOC135092521 [Scylla paramamosain]|uniref:uncharacterized protein LOC135092521 n=1 Tax=Scylla paramamosain TaxID=85552 RepID=UPI0030838939